MSICGTLDEVGRTFNVTRERIRQIESRSLKKLEELRETQKLRDIDTTPGMAAPPTARPWSELTAEGGAASWPQRSRTGRSYSMQAVTVTGEIGLLTATRLRGCFDRLLPEGAQPIQLDLRRVTFMDAAASPTCIGVPGGGYEYSPAQRLHA